MPLLGIITCLKEAQNIRAGVKHKYGNTISVDSKQAALETYLCKTKELQIHYSLYGGETHTRTLFLSTQMQNQKFKEGETNTIFVNLTKVIALNEKLLDTCMTDINIYNEDNIIVLFEEISENFHHIKITTLNRLQNQTVIVKYNFEEGMKKTKILTVPSSSMMIQQESERVNLIQTVTLAGVTVVEVWCSSSFWSHSSAS